MKNWKKPLKIAAITLGVVVIIMAATPFLFKDKIKNAVLTTLNKNLNATVKVEDVALNLFKNFPNAAVSIDQIAVINKAPFAGDTLFYAQQLRLQMAVTQLFNNENEPMKIEGFTAKNSKVNIIIDENGNGNYDIALKTEDKEETEEAAPSSLSVQLQQYDIENLNFTFTDKKSKMKVALNNINHSGKGNFANDILDLETHTTTQLSLQMDKANFINQWPVSLDAVLGIDLNQMKFSFKNNQLSINDLPLQFDGFVQLQPQGQLYDLHFNTPSSSFKNLLAMVPEAYRKSLDGIKTEGTFTVDGSIKGAYQNEIIPRFSVDIAAKNGTFQYPDLPKSVQNIALQVKIANTDPTLKTVYVNVSKFGFQIDKDAFSATAQLDNIIENAHVKAQLDGVVNLANISKAYPIDLKMPLSGILEAHLFTDFDQNAVMQKKYQNIKNNGTLALKNFGYAGPELPKPLRISNAKVAFSPQKIQLQQLAMKTGNSDITGTGVLNDFYGFIFNNQPLKGNVNLQSNALYVSDFMQSSTATTTTTTDDKVTTKTALKIPAFLDVAINAKANKVVYDNITLQAVGGSLLVKDQSVQLQNVKSNAFGGAISFDGVVGTKTATPTFKMNLGLQQVDIAQSFSQLNMLQKIIPIAKMLTGKLNSTVALSGNLDAKALTPNLESLSGDLLGQLLSGSINKTNSPLSNALKSQIKFLDFDKLNLKDLKAKLSFKDGKVTVKPFDIKYQDAIVTVGGTHSFSQLLDYDLKFDIPAKYLGNDVQKILNKVNPDAANDRVVFDGDMLGSIQSPKFTTNIKQAIAQTTQKLAQKEKEKLVGKGADVLTKAIMGKKATTDTTKTTQTKTEAVKGKATELLNGLFKRKKQE